jgi:hypothetical protein
MSIEQALSIPHQLPDWLSPRVQLSMDYWVHWKNPVRDLEWNWVGSELHSGQNQGRSPWSTMHPLHRGMLWELIKWKFVARVSWFSYRKLWFETFYSVEQLWHGGKYGCAVQILHWIINLEVTKGGKERKGVLEFLCQMTHTFKQYLLLNQLCIIYSTIRSLSSYSAFSQSFSSISWPFSCWLKLACQC